MPYQIVRALSPIRHSGKLRIPGQVSGDNAQDFVVEDGVAAKLITAGYVSSLGTSPNEPEELVPVTSLFAVRKGGKTVGLRNGAGEYLAGMGGQASGLKVSLIGDSRTQDYWLSQNRIGGRSWFAWANAYMGCPLEVIAEYATSGYRSDQYFIESNFSLMLVDGAQIAVLGFPFVNDISQAAAGYSDVDGNAVTLSNVQALVMARHQNRVQRLVDAGKTVVVCTEPGSTNFSAAQIAVLHSINAALRATYLGSPAVKLFDPVDLIWSRVMTASAIAIKGGYSADGTHATTRWGQFVGRYAAEKFFPGFLTPRKSYGVDLAIATQLFPNAGYTAATGGTTSNITGSDPLPANVVLNAAAAGFASYAASTASASDGSGNELTLTVTATSAGVVRLDHRNIPTAGLGYTDTFVGGLDVNVTASSNCRVYGDMQLFTNQGTEDGFSLYAGDVADVWTPDGTTGDVRMQSAPVQPPVGSFSGLAPQYRLFLDFKAAGSVTVKLKDPTVYRK